MRVLTNIGKKTLALVLVVLFTFSMFPFQSAGLTYSGSASYASGKYYTRLIAVNKTGNQRTDIVNIARSQVGYQEGSSSSQLSGETSGGTNYTEYGRWYGMQDMWCAMFVSWCAYVAGVPSSTVTYHAYTPTGLAWFQNKGQAYSRATVANGGYTPQPGDIIYFKSARNNNTTNHVGIVTSYSGGTVYTVEGNTSSATISTNGGAVASKSYAISNTYIVYICKPSYTGTGITSSSYINTIDTSDSGSLSTVNGSVTNQKTAREDLPFTLSGWSVHSDGVDHYEWNINSTSWGNLNGDYRTDVAAATSNYTNCGTLNSFYMDISVNGWAMGLNTIDIRGYTKKGAYYTVGRLNVIVFPASGKTYMSTAKTTFALSEGVTVSAKGNDPGAWVGLFGANETPGSVQSYKWYEMGTNDVTVNLFTEGRDNGRGTIAPGNYKLYLFIEEGYYHSKSIDITIVPDPTSLCTLDFPNPTTQTLTKGESFLVRGWALHSSGIASFEIYADGGAYTTLPETPRADVLAAHSSYATVCADRCGFEKYVSTADLSCGAHTFTVRATAKDGSIIAIGTCNITVLDNNTSLSSNSSAYERGEGIVVRANSQNPDAWVGLYLASDTPSASTSAFYSYRVNKDGHTTGSDVTLTSQTYSSREITGGSYKIVLFKDSGYTVDKTINITITIPVEFECSLDSPNENTVVPHTDKRLYFSGWGLGSMPITRFEYSIDGAAYAMLTNVQRQDALAALPQYAEVCAAVNGFEMNVDVSALSAGDHTASVRALLSDGTYKMLSTVTFAVAAPTSTVLLTPKTGSGVTIDRENSSTLVYGVTTDTGVGDVCAMFNETCEIVDRNGNTVSSGRVGTGYKIRVYDSGVLADEVTVIIRSDLNGDGVANGKDLLRLKKYISDGEPLEYPEAAELTGDGNITSADVTAIVDYIVSDYAK